MEKARIPCGKLLYADEVSKDPHIQARRMIEYVDMEAPGMEKMPVSGIPMKLSKTPGKVVRRSPKVGEHNQEIYRDLLGYSEERIAGLMERGVV